MDQVKETAFIDGSNVVLERLEAIVDAMEEALEEEFDELSKTVSPYPLNYRQKSDPFRLRRSRTG